MKVNYPQTDAAHQDSIPVPSFEIDGTFYVLIKDLASKWNYTSSYHLIKKIVKLGHKSDILTSHRTLTADLLSLKLIDNFAAHFYISLDKIVSLKNDYADLSTRLSRNLSDDDDATTQSLINPDKVSIGQIFPHNPLPQNHSTFDSLTTSSKLRYYKSKEIWKFLPNSKLSFDDRLIVFDDALKKETSDNLPSQGYVHEFNVSNITKVPNYYMSTDKHRISEKNKFETKKGSSKLESESSKLNSSLDSKELFEYSNSKNLQLLVNSNDPEANTLAKYLYTRTYRGPGSGSYKDGAIVNKINRIPLTNENIRKRHKITKEVSSLSKHRINQNLKGLVYEVFNKYMVDHLLADQRESIEDFQNIEMLHNNLLFNLLLNTYRDTSSSTWRSYYKFKMTDHEQIHAVELRKLEEEQKEKYEAEVQNWKEIESKRAGNDMKEMERIQRMNYERQQSKMENLRKLQSNPSTRTSQLQELEARYEPQQYQPSRPTHPPKPVETTNLDILGEFTLPSSHPEIMNSIPLELRGKNGVSIKGPVSHIKSYPEPTNPQILNRIEIIKLPNLNEIGWENIRRHKSVLE